MSNPDLEHVDLIGFKWPHAGFDRVSVTVGPAVGSERIQFFASISRLWLAADLDQLCARAAELATEVGVGIEIPDEPVLDAGGHMCLTIRLVPVRTELAP